MKLRKNTVKAMFDIMECSLNGEERTSELEKLLSHDDYKVQFEFFNNHPAGIGFSPSDFIKMFNSLDTYSPSIETSKALTMRRGDLAVAFEKIELLKESLRLLETFDEEDLKTAVDLANEGLCVPLYTENTQIVVAIGVGVTGAFNQGDINFFDFVKTFSQKTRQGFIHILAHELHHKGYKEQFYIDYLQHRAVDSFIHFFSGEGLAIKFCNNFEGHLTVKMRNSEHTCVRYSYQYYMDNYDDIIAKFLTHLQEIDQGKYSTVESLENLFDKEYYYRDVEIDGLIHEFYLRNPISYYLGADLWGLLYDKLERDEFFDLLKNPSGIYERLVGLL